MNPSSTGDGQVRLAPAPRLSQISDLRSQISDDTTGRSGSTLDRSIRSMTRANGDMVWITPLFPGDDPLTPLVRPATPGRDGPQREAQVEDQYETRRELHLEGRLDMSWHRSASCGLTPQSAWPGAPTPDGLRSHRLAEAARPVLDRLDDMLKDTGALILLGDREGRIIRTVRDNTRISQMLLRRGVDDGASLSEDAVGNNGIGTPIETRAGAFIHGEQHFAEALKDFVCYGHPIVDPLTRRLVGAVDLTGMSADASRVFAPFVRKIVADIEARYVDTARADDRELWHRFIERTRNSDTATCAFGDEVVLASHSSLERLDAHDMTMLRRLVERDEVSDTVELSSGPVRVLASRVGRRGHLLDLTFPDEHLASGPAVHALINGLVTDRAPAADSLHTKSGAPTTGGVFATGSGSGTDIRTPVSQASAARGAHAVMGPAGTGRSTVARSIAGPEATHVRLAEADDSAAAWRDLAVPALRQSAGSLILDDVDLLDDADLRRLAAKLAGSGSGSAGGGLVVITSREDPRPAVTEVLDTCSARTVLRPLHERGSESTAIVERMVADLCVERGIDAPTVSARFADAVCSTDLPNGLVSLRSILAECLGGGNLRLDVDTLPARARSARPPQPGKLARGEYDAIVAALADCNGVRSRAAKRLGISRTTLYARMRDFGLS